MPSISSPAARTRGSARRAANSPAVRTLARAGLVARGIIYVLISWVAILVAVGQSSREADQEGALQLLAGKPYGMVSLWLLGASDSSAMPSTVYARPVGGGCELAAVRVESLLP